MTTSCPPTTHDWHKGPMLGFDLETTGLDVERERIVTAALVDLDLARRVGHRTTHRLVDPGVEIPEQASAIHGITTEQARQHGEQPAVVLHDLVTALGHACNTRTPIVGMNLVYDLTLLDRECRRHGVTPLSDVVDRVAPVIDVLVLDKAMDRYRKGSRKLSALCEHYGVELDDAHNSAADALAAMRVAWALAVRFPALRIDPLDLHDAQTRWAAGQRTSFAAYKAAQGEQVDANPAWPIRPHRRQEPVSA